MSVSKEEVQHIVDLARLGVPDEELEVFRFQLSSVLGYVEQLSEVDTEGVEYQYQVVGLENVSDDDGVITCDEESGDLVVDAFPDSDGDLLKVKGVFK